MWMLMLADRFGAGGDNTGGDKDTGDLILSTPLSADRCVELFVLLEGPFFNNFNNRFAG